MNDAILNVSIIVRNASDFTDFLLNAKPGAFCVYHVGRNLKPGRGSEPAHSGLIDEIRKAARAKAIHMFQRRLTDDGKFAYLAQKT